MNSDTASPLAPLVVFDRLEVGPVRLEPKRLTAPYRVFRDGQMEETELIYSYEEAVFDPAEPESMNLAGMIAAQVALNYTLFCRQVVFHGLFDAKDRRFLRSMAENTAREIYVKKFLEPNPFLIGGAARLPAVRQKTYGAAALVFSEASARKQDAWQLWVTDKNRHAILSSGGKDSLLTYGLMAEVLGEKGALHPIFVNESGRHWFTAITAYRHFKTAVPGTARVWTNADRVFAWMLKRLPFIRKDFADIRADIYPVRLWTVAVFIFGALPLMRKNSIGRLLIGDEFDTTVRARCQGISHYDGLYDQSLPFDHALSGYFLQKGWSMVQFSVLRPLSELLIQKILSERYPNLQRLQVSCHAAHKDGDRVRPCGRCEKCRRIIGMMSALGADPGACGYTPDQVAACLKTLVREGSLHQEAAGTEHLLYLLKERGLAADLAPKVARARPEVLKLRFDPKRSPLHAIPQDLRSPLVGLLLEHADGALMRRGRRWVATDLLDEAELFRPYPFERRETSRSGRDSGGRSGFDWGEMTWPDAENRFRSVDIALLPVGAIEQHGPHLPLDTDAFDAEYLARSVAGACSGSRPLVLPLIPYGVSYHHDDFPGTVSIGNDTLARLVHDVGMAAARNGIAKLVIINGHGGNGPALNHAAQMINRDARIFVCVDSGETSDVDIDAVVETLNDVHAGEIETSTSLALRPHLVRTGRMQRAVPDFSSRYLNFSSKRGVSWYAHTRRISETGVMGDPTRADAAKGERIWEIMIAHLVSLVEDLKALTLDEIHSKRY